MPRALSRDVALLDGCRSATLESHEGALTSASEIHVVAAVRKLIAQGVKCEVCRETLIAQSNVFAHRRSFVAELAASSDCTAWRV